MKHFPTKIDKSLISSAILAHIPHNKRGFPSSFSMPDIITCIIHKLKTGCQWSCLFLDLEAFEPPFSWQSVYYFYNKWSKAGVFEKAFEQIQKEQKDKLALDLLNLDGTQTLAKKGGEEVAFQGRKKGKTSNLLVLVDEQGLPLAFGDILSGNQNDFFAILPQFARMCRGLNFNEVNLEKATLNMDKGFDSQGLRRAIQRRNMKPNVKENKRNRKKNKRGRKRFFDEELYAKRFCVERTFAWFDAFRSLIIRYETSIINWKSLHFLAAIIMYVKV